MYFPFQLESEALVLVPSLGTSLSLPSVEQAPSDSTFFMVNSEVGPFAEGCDFVCLYAEIGG